MLVRDTTHKVKVWDHNDAVIYVYERIYSTKIDPKNPDKKIYKQHTNVITAVPVNFNWDDDKESRIKRVEAAATALEDLYATEPDTDIGVCYVINTPYVNGQRVVIHRRCVCLQYSD